MILKQLEQKECCDDGDWVELDDFDVIDSPTAITPSGNRNSKLKVVVAAAACGFGFASTSLLVIPLIS